MIAKFTHGGAEVLRRVIANERRRPVKPTGVALRAGFLGFGICLFEAMQASQGSIDGSATFPAKIIRWNGSSLVVGGSADQIEIRDFQRFAVAMGARGIAVNLFNVWWHVTSSCPT